MIVVMAYGYAVGAGKPPTDMNALPFGSNEMLRAMLEMASVFEDDVIEALIPFIDTTFRTIPDRRASGDGGSVDGWYAGVQDHTWSSRPAVAYIGGFSGAAGELVFRDRKLEPRTDYNESSPTRPRSLPRSACCGWVWARGSPK